MGGEGYRMLDASRLRQRQPSTSVVLVGVVAATVTALVWGIPALLFAYPLPGVAVFTARSRACPRWGCAWSSHCGTDARGAGPTSSWPRSSV